MGRGARSDLQTLAEVDPEGVKKTLEEEIAKGKGIKALSMDFGLAYHTLYSLMRRLGVSTKTNKSILSKATGLEWGTMDHYSLGLKYGMTYTATRNYYNYHKEEVDAKVKAYFETLGKDPPENPE